MGHLFLVGYRGSGKSTIGHQLAERLGRQFVDTDDEIERMSGTSVKQIFEAEGEAGFRDREQVAVAECASRDGQWVIALGGGAILRAENRKTIKEHGKSIWLHGSAEALYQRIVEDSTSSTRRPDLSAGGGYEEVVEMLSQRESIYAEVAEFTVETDSLKPDQIVVEIADWVESNA